MTAPAAARAWNGRRRVSILLELVARKRIDLVVGWLASILNGLSGGALNPK